MNKRVKEQRGISAQVTRAQEHKLLVRLCSYALVLLLSGCAENKYIKTTDNLCVPSVTKQALMTSAESVLAEMRFTIEKYDVESGSVRTYPLPGAQTFEFWRADSVGSFNQTEADLHSILRTVELTISEQAGQICINCTATTQRLSLPQGLNDEQGYATLVETRRSAEKLLPGVRQKTNAAWTNLGRDAQLETEIIKRIEIRLSTPARLGSRLAATDKEQNK